MTVVASDTFTRANQSGWGTASDGETWTQSAGSGTLAISSNQGTITGSTALQLMLLGSNTTYPAKVKVRTSRTSTTDINFVTARLTAGNNYYRVKVQSGTIYIFKDIAGTITNLANTAFTDTAGSEYWIEFYLNGSTLGASIWLDGNSQPGSYMISTTDTSIAVAGQYGVGCTLSGSAHIATFDNFTVDNLVVPNTANRFVYGHHRFAHSI